MMKAGETLKSRGVPMKNKTKRKNKQSAGAHYEEETYTAIGGAL